MLLRLLTAFLLFSALSTTTNSADLNSDRTALLSFRSAVGGRTFLWNTSASDHCTWPGVQCDNESRVVVLRLPASSLSGPIPPNTLSSLTSLRTLSLRLNHLSGPLPSDLSHLSELRNLYLQGNHFSSPLPTSLFSIHSLVRLNLADNNFTGPIPDVLNNLTRLRTLYLENNHFSGVIPELNLPNLEQFNVSYNVLNGSIPVSLQKLPENAFAGNELCGKPLNVCNTHGKIIPPSIVGVDLPNVNDGKKNNGLSGGAIAGIVIGTVVGMLLVLLLLFLLCRRGKAVAAAAGVKSEGMEVSGEKPMVEQPENGGVHNGSNGLSVAAAAAAALTGNAKAESDVNGNGIKKLVFFGNGSRVFDLEDLLRASAEVLGKGTFGTAYKAVLEMGNVVAVKRLKDVIILEQEFRDRIEGVGAMDHENLVPLRAYYYSREEKLLVYDYMSMGSLSALLHSNKGAGRTPLNWQLRSNIALGAARGIEYLHSQGPNISHGNIKSSNILLTTSYEARVSDFGLSQLVGPPSTPTRVAGYRAPEVTDPRKVSQKADVYSFGVLLLELLTGKAPTHALLNEEGIDLPRWVQSIVREEWTSEVFDLELLRYHNVEGEMVELLQLAIDCANQYPDNRPPISEVANRIEELSGGSNFQGDQVKEID